MIIHCKNHHIDFTDFNHAGNDIHVHVRGYIIHHDKMFFGHECVSFVYEDYLTKNFVQRVEKYNGCWQVIIVDKAKNILTLINDRWGTYPLYLNKSDKELFISDQWKELLPFCGKEMDKQSSFEMAAFGYVMGDRTLLEHVKDLPPHVVFEFDLSKGDINSKKYDYWHLRYKYNKANEKKKEREFADLWNRQLKIYAEGIKRIGNTCYIPMSGGLDSRLLASSMDRNKIQVEAMTFGAGASYGEIEAANNVMSKLHYKGEHYKQFLDQDKLEELAASDDYPDRLTCGYFGQMYLNFYTKIRERCSVIMPGYSGDFTGGSLIRSRMLSWKSNNDAIDYILSQRSAPMVKVMYGDEKYRSYIEEAIESSFPNEDDVISNYVRWFLENDIRRYLIRSVIMNHKDGGYVVLPFFDYELIDFFLELPVKLLVNKRLYVNTQIKYLYKDYPGLLKVHRAKPKEPIKKIRGVKFYEYSTKAKNMIKKYFSKPEMTTQWDNDIDWYKIYGNMELPAWMDKALIFHPKLQEKPTYIKYFDAVAFVYKELMNA